MTGYKCYLTDFKAYDGGFVSFGDGKGRISGKGKIKTRKLDFDDVYFCKELKYNLFSISQMCDKNNNVFLLTLNVFLSSNFKLLDESQVLLRVLRKDNIYSVDLKSVVPTRGLTCLFAKATLDESNLWHRRLGHINFKTTNNLVKGNLVRGLPSKIFQNDNSCVACQKGKQHKASYKAKLMNTISKPLHMLHMDLFGPINVKSLMKKSYCLGVTDGFSRYSWASLKEKLTRDILLGTKWKWTRLFDIDSLTISMNYVPVIVGNQTNGTKDSAVDAEKKAPKVDESEASDNGGKNDQVLRSEVESLIQQERQTETLTVLIVLILLVHLLILLDHHLLMLLHKPINVVGPSASTNAFEEYSFERFSPFKNAFSLPHVPIVSPIDDSGIFGNAYDDEVLEEEVDMNNVDSSYTIPEATKFLKDHSQEQVIGSLETPVQTRQMSKTHKEFGLLSSVHKLRRTNHKDFQNCLFACFLSQMEPKKPVQALQDPSWVKAMQDELLQNKKNKRGIVIKNKARLVAQGHTQEEGIDYDEVFAPVARIEAIRLFLAYASFKYFVVYQMDVKSAFLYGRIEERLRFVLDCVLSWIAFCLSEDHLLYFAKDKLCQTQNCVAFCLQEDCVLSSRRSCVLSSRRSCVLPWKHCVLPKSRIAFCLQEDLAFCLQEDLAFCLGSIAFCLNCDLFKIFIAFCLIGIAFCIILGLRFVKSTTTSITPYLLKILHHFHFIIHQSFIMTTPTVTSSTNSQMHNNIMAAGSRDRPPMLTTGRYPQWRSRPYKPITILVQAVDATDDSSAIPEHTTVETPMNMSPENKAYFLAEKEAIHLILTRIGDEIYLTVDACQTAQEIWEAIERLQQEWSRFVMIVKQQHKLDAVSYHKLFDILKQYQKEVNKLRAERLAREANPLALISHNYQTQGKEIAKPITPPSEKASEEDSDPEQAQRDKDMQKNLALVTKYFKKIYKPTNNNLRTSSNSRNKNVDTTPRYKNDDHSGQFGNHRTVNVAGAREKVGKTDEEVDEQELEAHYSYMAKIQEVPTADSGTNSEPLEQVQNKARYNVFANELQHYEQSESVINTCLMETDDSNVIPDSPDMCEDAIQNDQNDVESDDERVALANLKLDVDENKKIQKQLKKANTTLAQELKECKTILTETSKSLGESISVRDSFLVTLQTKQTEFEKYKDFNDKTKVITDLKLREERDIDKMLSMEKQLKFLNEIVYKRSQSIQTIHMMATKVPTYNGRPTFANPRYLKQAQSKIPCLYAFPYDQSTHANRLISDEEKTLALERESRSSLNKDLVRPYDYTNLNSLYEIFKPPTQEYEIKLAHANEIRRKMWRKSFVKSKLNIYKNVRFLPVSKSISKSRQAYNVMTNNINHFKEIVDNAWIKHSKDQFRPPTAQDMEILIQTCLMPLAIKTQNDSFKFVHELKQEMHDDLKYIETLEKEIDELESDKVEFSNMYDVILQECISKDVMCTYLQSLSDLDALDELQCLYLHKVKECDCLAQKLSNQTESVSKEVHSEL
nr:putative ribonuclease H-like domain-containing protein [Tanacetum cinerariifolium]